MVPRASTLTHPLTCQNLNHAKYAECTSLASIHFIHPLPILHRTEAPFQTGSNHYFVKRSAWEFIQIVHWFQWPVSFTQTWIRFWLIIIHLQALTQTQSNAPDNFDFSSIALVPSVAEDIYATTVTKNIDMTDVSPLVCRWSSLMITNRLYFPLLTHLKWTSGIFFCNPPAIHQQDPSTEQQLGQMSRMISTFFG